MTQPIRFESKKILLYHFEDGYSKLILHFGKKIIKEYEDNL